MDKTLMSFLVELATDPRKLSDYQRDREAYLLRTRLSPEARHAVLSGDQGKIEALAGSEWALNTFVEAYKKKKKKSAKKKAKTAKKKAKPKAKKKAKR